MANLFGGFLKRIEKPQDTHPPSVPQEFSQYDNEYVTYCIEQEKALSDLEKTIHSCEDPNEITTLTLRKACALYAADWTGIIEADMELGVTTTGNWFNPDPKITKLQRMYEFENFFPMQTWQRAIKTGQPIVILDVNEVARTSPQEYQTYRRLDVHTLISIPFGPKPTGFLVLRNPKQYNTFTSAARGFAYIVHCALAHKRAIDRAKMALTPEEIKSDKDVIINFFGDMEITTQDGVWKELDFASPKCCRTAAYIMLQRKSAHSALAIADALYPEETADIDTINKNIRGYIYRFRKSFEPICKHKLIEYTSNGYRLNPTLNIKTDLQQFETIWEQVQQDIPITHKVYMLKRAVKLYKGAVFQSSCDDHWLVGIATEYKMKYISMVNELLSILAEFEDYDGVHHFALKAIKLVPENVKAQYWLVYSMYHAGAVTIAKQEIKQAKLRLTEEEFATLKKYIAKDGSLQDCLPF